MKRFLLIDAFAYNDSAEVLVGRVEKDSEICNFALDKMKRIAALIFISTLALGVNAQYINIHFSDSTVESYALADVRNITFDEDELEVLFTAGLSFNWNFSVINYIDYEDLGLDIEGQPIISLDEFAVYPNPSAGQVNVKLSTTYKGEIAIQIYNIEGLAVQTIYQGKINGGPSHFSWEDANNPAVKIQPGVYFCVVSFASQKVSRTVIIIE